MRIHTCAPKHNNNETLGVYLLRFAQHLVDLHTLFIPIGRVHDDFIDVNYDGLVPLSESHNIVFAPLHELCSAVAARHERAPRHRGLFIRRRHRGHRGLFIRRRHRDQVLR